jgi:hypothetical protein
VVWTFRGHSSLAVNVAVKRDPTLRSPGRMRAGGLARSTDHTKRMGNALSGILLLLGVQVTWLLKD